jgi:hypothetical protein
VTAENGSPNVSHLEVGGEVGGVERVELGRGREGPAPRLMLLGAGTARRRRRSLNQGAARRAGRGLRAGLALPLQAKVPLSRADG